MNNGIDNADEKYITPAVVWLCFYVCALLSVLGGLCYAWQIWHDNYLWRTWQSVGLTVLDIIVVLLTIVVLRVGAETISVFFEQNRVQKQVREKLQAGLEILGTSADAERSMAKSLSNVVSRLAVIEARIAEVGLAVSSLSTIRTSSIHCPHCGREMDPGTMLLEGQHVICPHCAMKFTYHKGI